MILIKENMCDFCGTCVSVCPPDSIELKEAENGIPVHLRVLLSNVYTKPRIRESAFGNKMCSISKRVNGKASGARSARIWLTCYVVFSCLENILTLNVNQVVKLNHHRHYYHLLPNLSQ